MTESEMNLFRLQHATEWAKEHGSSAEEAARVFDLTPEETRSLQARLERPA